MVMEFQGGRGQVASKSMCLFIKYTVFTNIGKFKNIKYIMVQYVNIYRI